ncbi:MAG: serine protease, partial [Pseudomonadota bacterium]
NKAAQQQSAPFEATVSLTKKGARAIDAFQESAAIIEIANAIWRAVRLVEYRLRSRKPGDLVIVSEGDSWFQYPALLHDIIDEVMEIHPVRSLGGSGHLITDMEMRGEFEDAIRKERPHVFLLSGGGNDLLGKVNGTRRLLSLLHPYKKGASTESLIDLNALGVVLDEVERAYLKICTRALAIDSNLRILLHGYDHALPRANGVWLREPMDKLGIPKGKQREIVRLLIDRFYDLLDQISEELGPNVEVLNVRGKVGKTTQSWTDELHPKDEGFKRVSEIFLKRLGDIKSELGLTATPILSSEAIISPAAVREEAEGPFADFLRLQPLTSECKKGVCRFPGGPNHASPEEAKRWARVNNREICSNLDAWRDGLNGQDLRAYEAVLRLRDSFGEPDEFALLNLRESLRRSLPGLRPLSHGSSHERILGESNFRGVAYLARGLGAAKAVGRVRAQDPYGQPSTGSGFLVGENLLLTNNHVLSDGMQAHSEVDFNFELEPDGRARIARTFQTDPGLFLTDKELDFTMIGLKPVSLDGSANLSDFGRLRLLPDSGKALKREPVSIIQHPSAAHKVIALRDSRVLGRDGDHLYYTTDTEAGSSGAPVLSDDWHVVALHHRTVPNPNEPCTWVANRGIRISSIVNRLQDIANGSGPYAGVAREMAKRVFAPDPVATSGTDFADGGQNAGSGPMDNPFGDPMVEAERVDPSAEKVFGFDQRQQLSQTDSRHAAIMRTFSRSLLGTSVVVGPRLALTVSHVLTPRHLRLYRFDDMGQATDVAAEINARDYRERNSSASGRARQFSGLQMDAQRSFPTRLAPTLVSPSELVGAMVEVIGYPERIRGQVADRVCAHHWGQVAAVEDGLIFYTGLDVSNGQSGGAVVLAGTNKLVGLHLSGPVQPIPPGLLDVNIG